MKKFRTFIGYAQPIGTEFHRLKNTVHADDTFIIIQEHRDETSTATHWTFKTVKKNYAKQLQSP